LNVFALAARRPICAVVAVRPMNAHGRSTPHPATACKYDARNRPARYAPRAMAARQPLRSAVPLDETIEPSIGLALAAYAGAELDRAIALLGWSGGRIHEGVHQARKSLRRARAIVALGGEAMGAGARLIDREVRRINVGLSTMRDAQALVETLDRLIADKRTPGDVLPVLRRARRTAAPARAERARRELSDDPGLAEKRNVLRVLRAAMIALPWTALAKADVRDVIDTGFVRIETAGARARATGRDDDWHRWRRRVRRLTQQHRAIGDRLGDIAFARKRCKKLAELLGEAQDFALLREHCGRRSIFSDADRRVLADLAEHGTASMRARIVETLAIAAQPVSTPNAAIETPN
jgi:CHAD domain-containing protein